MGQYYDLIMEPTSGSFSSCFNEGWRKQLENFAAPYSNAIQLRIGNQLRPKLTCWGAALNTSNANEINLALVADVASYIEMLHKASIILDDMIDDDDARHGKKAFHIEFGRENAMIFSLALLGRGTAGINKVFENSQLHFKSVDLYSNTIYKMAIGCLEELKLNGETRFDVSRIRNIINLETISLIRNSLLLGYWSNYNPNSGLEEVITEIGSNCGYIFQILNDLEPFTSMDKNEAYKGGRNIDVNRDRKNIVVAYIFGAATSSEQKSLLALSGDSLLEYIMELFNKYSISNDICEEARSLKRKTIHLIENCQINSLQPGCLQDFSAFVNDMVNICFSKLR